MNRLITIVTIELKKISDCNPTIINSEVNVKKVNAFRLLIPR
jgi:hypothetical protein